MELQDINAYRERLENEYTELLGYRKGILKQISEDEKALKDITQKKEYLLKEVAGEIVNANKALEGIRRQRKEYLEGFTDKELEISVNLIHVEEKRKELERELKEAIVSKENYDAGIKELNGEKAMLERETILMNSNRLAFSAVIEMEKSKVQELDNIKRSLESRKKKQDRIIKDLKIKGIKLDQRSEAVKKTKDYLINKQEEINNQKLLIESRMQQLRSALEEIKSREAKLNG